MKQEKSDYLSGGLFCGMILMILGSLFLLQNLGYISSGVWGLFWPSLVILWGIAIILRPPSAYACCCYPHRDARRTE